MNRVQATSSKLQEASYKRLKVWQEAHKLVLFTYKITEKFPREEQFGLVNQMRRAAISIVANIVEGQSRQTRKEFTQFLYIAKGSLVELEYYFEVSLALKFINERDFRDISEQRILVGKLLTGFLRKIKP